MISPDAKLSLELLPLECLQCKLYEPRYLDRLLLYVQKLRESPNEYAGVLHVVPSDTHPGLYVILDGHTRFCASLLVGRRDALCLIVEDPHQPHIKESHAHAHTD